MVLDKHAPIKSKKSRENYAPFMSNESSNAIMNTSKLRNRYRKWPSRENFLAFKKQENFCND